MKRFVSAVAGLLALGGTGLAFAQTGPSTACPVNFTCAFSAAETTSLIVPKPNLPGQPDVFVGYMVFDGSSIVTLTGVQNLNGTVSKIGGTTGLVSTAACTAGTGGQPATIEFPDSSEISFVTDSSGNELQFIITKDNTGSGSNAANRVRIGICRKQ